LRRATTVEGAEVMARLSYDAMRNLILDNIDSIPNPTIFTPELLTAIFWEETGFQNIPQFGGGPAVGFGQVERATIKAVNFFFKTNYTPELILADDNASVRITSLTLSQLLVGTGSKLRALRGYAGAASNPANAPIPARWLECERQLMIVHASDRIPGSAAIVERLTYAANADAIKTALRAAKPNSNPDLAFPTSDGSITT
jgi:hypothetical protein